MTTDKKVFSLLQLLQSVSSVISKTYNRSYWIKAEIAKVNEYKYSGHCYPELVEKQNGKVVAQIRGIIWAKTFKEISKKFEEVTKEPLKEGMMVVLLARVDFNPLHGFSVNITDIDPAYTLGDMLREKNLAIERLRKERIFEQNKTLELPVLPRRIAIISVGTSKGFQDFNNVLADFKSRYRPFIRLFPALLQGDRAVESLMKALAEIVRYEALFDTVLILRGGGSDIGLNCYDDYELAAAVARCPLPVITGIGHSTNETVTEMVAWKNMITPTETAYFLMARFADFEKSIQKISNATVEIAQSAIDRENKLLRHQGERLKNAMRHKNLNMSHKVSLQVNNLKSLIRNTLFNKESALVHASQKLSDHAQANLKNGARRLDVQKNSLTQMPPVLIKNAENKLEMSRIKISSYDLNAVLDRGFSITRFDGKVIGDPALLRVGDAIHTRLKNGEIISIIKKIKSNG
ncbi:exodeoxyribonuclease VII large subunit [Bacteroidales bacterium OttesenSCG-928-J16]|nr:exodeoxyribonuclease VII large subunit [Bacteroidales bacterium OttesenSCG-928-J16]